MSQTVSIPVEHLQLLAPAAEALGLPLPGAERFAPTINVAQSIRALAHEVGSLVAKRNIFLRAGEVVTVDETTGVFERMTAKRFPSWVEEFCAFIAPGSRRVRESLSMDDAVQILEADPFKAQLRPLNEINTMRLPVLRASGEIEFLAPGYDVESRIFTVDLIQYDMDWALDRATTFFDGQGMGYPLAWPDELPEEARKLSDNRSWGVQMAAIMGTFCRAMFPPGTRRPMIAYIANQPGTGKSTLVSMALNHVFGFSATTKTPRDNDKMDSELETTARTFRPYVFFDDIGAGMFSNPLNRFITSQYHSGRVMGGNTEVFTVPAVTQVFATGNGLKLSADLMRRGLFVELFLAGEVRGRKFPHEISPEWLSLPEVRRDFLSACCALVKHYIASTNGGKDRRPLPSPLPSFEAWTNLVGGIVVTAGYVDPTTPPDLIMGGAEDEDEMREFLIRLASETAVNTTFTKEQIVGKAREFGLLEGLVGTGDEKVDGKKLGLQLRKWRARELVDRCGRVFRFDKKRKSQGANYPLEFLTPPAQGKAAPVVAPAPPASPTASDDW